jgi:hypothetical protein
MEKKKKVFLCVLLNHQNPLESICDLFEDNEVPLLLLLRCGNLFMGRVFQGLRYHFLVTIRLL